MKVVVFLGPTLPLDQARGILDAVYLRPAKQSDLLSAAINERPDVIGLIDGVFLQSLSVWHKEILFALDQGIRVYGASSIGAIRAAETAAFGMVGVGEIARMYMGGELTDDDEVALAHGPEESAYCKLSEPMVNVRATFRAAHESGLIDDGTCRRLIAVAKDIYFAERSFPTIYARAMGDGLPAEIVERLDPFVKSEYVDLKARDAIRLLEIIRDCADALPSVGRRFSFARTSQFDTLYNRDRTVRRDGVNVPLEAIANYVALHHPSFRELNFNALNRVLVVNLAKLLEVDVGEEDVDDELRRLRATLDLAADDAFTAWLQDNDQSLEEIRALMLEVALCRRLQRWLLVARWMDRSTKPILDELRLRNEYSAWARRASAQERLLESGLGVDAQGPQTLQELLDDHQQWTDFPLDVGISVWAEEAGFHTDANLKMELLRAKLARTALLKLVAEAAGAEDRNEVADHLDPV